MHNSKFVELLTGEANERFLHNLEAFLSAAHRHNIADFGMQRSDGSAKIWENMMRDLGGFAKAAAPYATGLLSPEVAIILPQSLQLSVTTHRHSPHSRWPFAFFTSTTVPPLHTAKTLGYLRSSRSFCSAIV